MKRLTIILMGIVVMIPLVGMPSPGLCGNVEEIKKESKEAVSEIKDGAVETGKAVAETGKEIKDGAVQTGVAVKEKVKAVGQGFKKAFQETKDAIKKEFTGDDDHVTQDDEQHEEKE